MVYARVRSLPGGKQEDPEPCPKSTKALHGFLSGAPVFWSQRPKEVGHWQARPWVGVRQGPEKPMLPKTALSHVAPGLGAVFPVNEPKQGSPFTAVSCWGSIC